MYKEQPEGFEQGKRKMRKFQKSIYGLKASPRNWNECFHMCMLELGFKRSENDWCLYSKVVKNIKMYILFCM